MKAGAKPEGRCIYLLLRSSYLLRECFAPTDIFAFIEMHPLNVELLSRVSSSTSLVNRTVG